MKNCLFLLTLIIYIFMINVTDIETIQAQDDLYVQLTSYSKEINIEPIDAYCDPIYHLIPGYNGLYVDVEKSYENMDVFDEKKIIFKEVKPKISINDLTCGPIYKGNPNKKAVTFLINVAWGEEYLSEVLSILNNHNISANFFIEGNFLKNNYDSVVRIAFDDHIIANHSYSHANFTTLSSYEQRLEIEKTNLLLEELFVEKISYFGPPSGAYNGETITVTNELNMKTIMWTLDTIDWQKPSRDTIINRIVPNLENGAIILMHPTQNTALALEELIINIQSKGYAIENLDSLLSSKRIE